MTVTATNGVTSSTATSPTSTSSTGTTGGLTASYDTFLQLLVTELQNQDPTKPMDPTETVSQLATFSNVEQGIKSNTTLSSLLANSSLSQASSIVGRTVTTSDGQTSGIVTSVTTSASGSTATLQSGATVSLQSGVTIS